MTENNNHLQKYAMLFGTYMGIFWIFSFILFPLGLKFPFLQILLLVLMIAAPFLGYRYVRMYRDQVCNGQISFISASIFTIFMYMFASLLSAVAYYIYFQFIDHGYLAGHFTQIAQQFQELQPVGVQDVAQFKEAQDLMVTSIKTTVELMELSSPVEIALIMIAMNVRLGFILTIPTALFVMKRKKNIGGTTDTLTKEDNN